MQFCAILSWSIPSIMDFQLVKILGSIKMSLLRTLFIAAIFALNACGAGNVRPVDELQSATSTQEEYKINPGDVLMIKVWGEPRLSGEVFVRNDGSFTLPLINDVKAEGRSLEELRGEVTKRLKEFIPAAQVTATILQSAPTKYFLAGQFLKPGEYRSDGRITLLQAIATAGGFAAFADESAITLIRKSVEGDLRYRLDYNRVVDGKDPNPELKSGDFISVK